MSTISLSLGIEIKTINNMETVLEYDKIIDTFKTLKQEALEIRLIYFVKPIKWRKCNHKNVSDIGSVGFLPSITNDQARVYDGWCDDCGEHVFGLTNGVKTRYNQTVRWDVSWTTNRNFVECFHGMTMSEDYCLYLEKKFKKWTRGKTFGWSSINSYL